MSVALDNRPEIINHKYLPYDYLGSPDLIDITDIDFIELNAKEKLDKLVVGIGKIALSSELSNGFESPINNLRDAIVRAKDGDEQAIKLVKTNIKTDALERTMKAGFVMSVAMEVGENGEIYQYGQTLDSVNINSLVWASGSDNSVVMRRSLAEARNSQRLKICNELGLLEDYIFFVASRTDDELGSSELQKLGFFTDTMSISGQGTSYDENGNLKLETVFIAGSDDGDSRFDKEMLVGVINELSGGEIDITGLSATELLDKPFLIRKDLLPNGMVDIARMCDKYSPDSRNRFFGSLNHQNDKDYLLHKKWCDDYQSGLSRVVDSIYDELLKNVSSSDTPVEATKKLGKTSAKYMLTRAIHDDSIDPKVFGSVSANYIYQARYYWQAGDFGRANNAAQKAELFERSSSCALDNGLYDTDSDKDAKENNFKESYGFDREMYCVVCQHPPRRDSRGNLESKKMCGPCGICRECDFKARIK